MRDYLLLAIVLGSAPAAAFNPFFGIVMWTFISFFNPHRYTWGIAYTFPVALVVGVPTLIGTVLSAGKLNRGIFTREAILTAVFWCWCSFTAFYATQQPFFSSHAANGVHQLQTFSKVLLMTFCTILVVNTKERLRFLLLFVAGSIGLHSLRALLFGVRTSGNSRVFGPPNSFFGDNNAFALAMNMIIPILFYLGWHVENRWVRRAAMVTFFAAIGACILTYSRGGVLGLGVVLAGITLKSRRKMIAVFLLVICGLALALFAPPAWQQRMGAVAEGKLDRSAQERIFTWKFAMNFAKAYPITGGGFNVFEDPAAKLRYAPAPTAADLQSWQGQAFTWGAVPDYLVRNGPHSMYFQVLGEQGFVGLAIFLALLLSSLLTLRQLRKLGRRDPEFAWMVPYTHMLELSFVGYAVSGAFLGLAYFDLYYTLVACVVLLRVICKAQQRASARQDFIASAETVAMAY